VSGSRGRSIATSPAGAGPETPRYDRAARRGGERRRERIDAAGDEPDRKCGGVRYRLVPGGSVACRR